MRVSKLVTVTKLFVSTSPHLVEVRRLDHPDVSSNGPLVCSRSPPYMHADAHVPCLVCARRFRGPRSVLHSRALASHILPARRLCSSAVAATPAASSHPPPRWLTTHITSAPSAHGLVQASTTHAAAFNAVHCSAFWVTLGRLVRADPEQRAWVRERPHELEQGVETTLRLLPTFNPRQLANSAHGAASAGLGRAPLFWSGLATAAEPLLRNFRSLELKDLAWAFAKATALRPPLIRALAAEALERVDEFKPEEVSILAWSFAVAVSGRESEEVSRLLAGLAVAAAASDLGTYGAKELATAVWAFGRADLGAPADGFFRAVATHLPERLRAGGEGGADGSGDPLNPVNIATLAWGLGRAGHARPELLEDLAIAARRQSLDRLNARYLATLATPYALCAESLLEESAALLDDIASHCARDRVLDTFEPPELTSLARAYANGLAAGSIDPQPELFSAISRRVPQLLPSCTERELSMLPWALIHAGASSAATRLEMRPTFEAIANESAPRLSEFRASGLVALCWSYSRHLDSGERDARGRAERARKHVPVERDLFRGIDDDEASDEARYRGDATELGVSRSVPCEHLLDMLAEEVAGRSVELSEHDAQTVETCFVRRGRPSPFGEGFELARERSGGNAPQEDGIDDTI